CVVIDASFLCHHYLVCDSWWIAPEVSPCGMRLPPRLEFGGGHRRKGTTPLLELVVIAAKRTVEGFLVHRAAPFRLIVRPAPREALVEAGLLLRGRPIHRLTGVVQEREVGAEDPV